MYQVYFLFTCWFAFACGYYYEPPKEFQSNFILAPVHHVPLVPLGYRAYPMEQRKPKVFKEFVLKLPSWIKNIEVFHASTLNQEDSVALDQIYNFISSSLGQFDDFTPDHFQHCLLRLWEKLTYIPRYCPALVLFKNPKLPLAAKFNILDQCLKKSKDNLKELLQHSGEKVVKVCSPKMAVENGHRYFIEALKVVVFLSGYKKSINVLDFANVAGHDLRQWSKELDEVRLSTKFVAEYCKKNWRIAATHLIHQVISNSDPKLLNQRAARKIFNELAQNMPWRRWIVLVFNDDEALGNCYNGKGILDVNLNNGKQVLVFSTENMEPTMTGPTVQKKIKKVLGNIQDSGKCLSFDSDKVPFAHAVIERGSKLHAHGHFDDNTFWHNFHGHTFFIWWF